MAKQTESGTLSLDGRDQSLQLVKTWTVDHVQADPKRLKATNRFTVSESGAIGISCEESPSLSVMYPDSDKPPVLLSDVIEYRSAIFLKVTGKEYLAVACIDDGCLYLWDIEAKTSKKIFDPQLPKVGRSDYMNIFKISQNTIGYGEVRPSPDGRRKIFILHTDTKEWNLTENS